MDILAFLSSGEDRAILRRNKTEPAQAMPAQPAAANDPSARPPMFALPAEQPVAEPTPEEDDASKQVAAVSAPALAAPGLLPDNFLPARPAAAPGAGPVGRSRAETTDPSAAAPVPGRSDAASSVGPATRLPVSQASGLPASAPPLPPAADVAGASPAVVPTGPFPASPSSVEQAIVHVAPPARDVEPPARTGAPVTLPIGPASPAAGAGDAAPAPVGAADSSPRSSASAAPSVGSEASGSPRPVVPPAPPDARPAGAPSLGRNSGQASADARQAPHPKVAAPAPQESGASPGHAPVNEGHPPQGRHEAADVPAASPAALHAPRGSVALDLARSTPHPTEPGGGPPAHTAPHSPATTSQAPAPSSDPAFPQRDFGVVRQIATRILNHGTDRDGQTRLEVRLDPPELGRVDVSLDISDRLTRISLVADRLVTADLLRRSADILVQQLRDSGIASFDLHFSDRGGNSAARPAPPRIEPRGQPEAAERPDGSVQSLVAGSVRARSRGDGLDLKV